MYIKFFDETKPVDHKTSSKSEKFQIQSRYEIQMTLASDTVCPILTWQGPGYFISYNSITPALERILEPDYSDLGYNRNIATHILYRAYM